MSKIDLKKKWKELYRPTSKKVTVVDVPVFDFLMVDGRGDPNTAQEYKEAVEALYGVSYTLKFMLKKGELGLDYVVMPLQGLWWVENMAEFSTARKNEWQWTMMIMQPPQVTESLVMEAIAQTAAKKELPALDKMHFTRFHEGLSAQIMYYGPYADEGPTIERIHQFIVDQGGQLHGQHHEIYLSDPRRTAPEKLKTVIRQPYHL